MGKSSVILLFSTAFLITSIFSTHPSILKQAFSSSESEENLPHPPGKRLYYTVKFNGIKVGRIEFEYQGRKKINKIYQDTIVIRSDVKILGFFQIKSKELVYVNADTYLPQKVEREVRFLGKEESILEEYNQNEGLIKITRKKGQTSEENLIYQKPPIHNSLILFFLYPLNSKDRLGEALEFNLPLQKIRISLKELRKIQTPKGYDEVYLWEVSNHRKSLAWIKKEERLLMRLEMPAFLGRVVITLIRDRSKRLR